MRASMGAVVLALLMLCGCVTQKMDSTFDPTAAAFIHSNGTGVISGQAFLRRNDGIVVYAAGSEVILLPSTPYTDERTTKFFQGQKFTAFGATFENDEPRLKDFRRVTKADGEGRFTFTGLPPGKYHVLTQVTWMVGYNRQGGALAEFVAVGPGETVNLVMSGM